MHDIFISYSHVDEEWKDRVAVFLKCLRLRKRVGFRAWNDDDIRIGEPFEVTIKDAVEQARVAILLVSPDFMASEFVYGKELVWMQELSEAGQLAVTPVLIRPSPLSLDPWLRTLQFHPDDKRALSTMPTSEIDETLTALTDEIDRLLVDSEVVSTDDETAGAVPPDDRERLDDVVREPVAPPPWEPLGHAELFDYLRDKTGAEPLADLLIFRTKRQRTWLVATAGSLFCLLDDARTQQSDRLVQWRQQVTALPIPVGTRPSKRDGHLGLLDIGSRQNWLYSRGLFDGPDDVVSKVDRLLEVARNAAGH